MHPDRLCTSPLGTWIRAANTLTFTYGDCSSTMENVTVTMSPEAKMICTAIQRMLRVHFVYNEKVRIGEPQCCGITTAGHEGVRMHMIAGQSC